MAKNKVEITGINTSELETLSQGEMAKLFKQYKSGSRLAHEKLVKGNLKLILSILKSIKIDVIIWMIYFK